MAQVTDRTIGANPTGFDMRTELNNIISALESDNSGSSEPLNTVAYMKWLDTSNATYYYYKERNHDNTGWVTLFRYTVATKIMEAVSNGIVLQDTAIEIHASTPKTTPIDDDEIGIWDSISSTLQKLTWANLKDTLKNYFDTLYVSLIGNQTIAGVKTFSETPIFNKGVKLINSASTDATTLNWVESATATLTMTGLTTTVTTEASFERIKNTVHISISSASGISNSASMTITGVPLNFRPSANRSFMLRGINNGVGIFALGVIGSSGVISLYSDAQASGWVSSGTKGIYTFEISYLI